ncbi:Crp/Fnr family transcriptional regulator [Phytomonospora endophytica]|uniref:CRP-like cAMP-binding protein n=1 Tax=Phytomonospora endophytica TaxID=714109 RepID=A0A841FPI8_9ACTN|nr:Crp/Fnr family transcriptional regulator [Phytomonospora endophytica]MBB6035167.1 CRP-like cAMP-binding protein [Phytomonospora endophytica]GIG64084.1 cAMP-binding protein [Phytomonospora endophytica]
MTPAHAAFAGYLRTWGDLPESELAKVGEVFRPLDVPERTQLVRAGERPGRVFFSLTGLSRIFHVDEGGTERIKAFRAEHELICAYSALLRDEPSDVHIETVEPSRLLVATRERFALLNAGHPGWREIIMRLTERRLVEEDHRHTELLRFDASRRYRNFLAAEPELAARLTQRLIASYIGVTPVQLSRIRAQLQRR